MEVSFIDLQKNSSQIVRALHRNERVMVLYRGKRVAVMHPIAGQGTKAGSARVHAAFGMWADRADMSDVASHVRKLHRGRCDSL
jgi:antitoxin (DNA-binding transcriptional repressor) of toxin-antitoxin stability system